METDFTTSLVTLDQRYYAGTDELVVDARKHDQLAEDHDYDLFEVQPGVVARGDFVRRSSGESVQVMRIGLLTVISIELVQSGSDPANTIRFFPTNGTAYHFSLFKESAEYVNNPTWFETMTVWWGDGSSEYGDPGDTNPGAFGDPSGVVHTYAAPGTYDVKVELGVALGSTFLCVPNPSAVRRFTVS
jgi:hypothetical protein